MMEISCVKLTVLDFKTINFLFYYQLIRYNCECLKELFKYLTVKKKHMSPKQQHTKNEKWQTKCVI